MKSFWMIEKNIEGVAHWWMRRDGQFGYWDAPERWTIDPNKARHYDEKWKAEHVIGTRSDGDEFMAGCIATEHTFMDR